MSAPPREPTLFDLDSVTVELEWLTALARDTPVHVPQPVATPAGAILIRASHPGVPEARTCALFRATAERVRATMQRLGEDSSVFGLIHADIHNANFRVEHGRIGLIDFEDCGWGYYLYDLAVVLDEIEAEYAEQAQVLRAALLHGYRQIRPLGAEHEALLDTFIAMRLAELVRWFGSSNRAEFEPSTMNLLRQATAYMSRLLDSPVVG